MGHVAVRQKAFDLDGFGVEIAPHHVTQALPLLPDKLTLASKCGQRSASRFFTSLDEFACLSVANYESASGLVIFVSRNTSNLTREDVGKPMAGAPNVLVTNEAVDFGLETLHRTLTSAGPFAEKQPQLRHHRMRAGDNCVWNVQHSRRLHSVSTKKVLRAVAKAGLRLRVFEVNHKCALSDVSLLVRLLPLMTEPPVDGRSTFVIYLDVSLMAPYNGAIALYAESPPRAANGSVDCRRKMTDIYPAGPLDTPGRPSSLRHNLSLPLALVATSSRRR
jgi:hypothetical protein